MDLMEGVEDFDWQARINIDPAIAAGRPVIRGTRVPVEVLVGNLGGGASIKELCEDYNVSEEDVRAALIYAAETLAAKRRHALPRR
jgi:uncharacterized protein (DUF433 family)